MNTSDILKYGHATIQKTTQLIPASEWETPNVCGVWSAKDIMAHLASFELVLVETLNALLEPVTPTPTVERFYQQHASFNDDEVAKRRSHSVDDVLAEYVAAHAAVMERIVKIPVERMRQNGILAWYGSAYDLEDFLVYTYYGHKREHSAHIAVFLDTLARSGAS